MSKIYIATSNPGKLRELEEAAEKLGWKAEVGINVGRWDATLGADQAAAMTRILGRKLVAVECGNEPDQWAGKALRPAGYDYAQNELIQPDRDYRPYLDPAIRAEFDEFCDTFDQVGMTTVNAKSLANRIDPDLVPAAAVVATDAI